MIEAPTRSWWPHADLRMSTYWRGKVWLFRVVPEATLEFADRTEIYELDSSEYRRMQTLTYNERIGELLRRRPDRVIDKIDGTPNWPAW